MLSAGSRAPSLLSQVLCVRSDVATRWRHVSFLERFFAPELAHYTEPQYSLHARKDKTGHVSAPWRVVVGSCTYAPVRHDTSEGEDEEKILGRPVSPRGSETLHSMLAAWHLSEGKMVPQATSRFSSPSLLRLFSVRVRVALSRSSLSSFKSAALFFFPQLCLSNLCTTFFLLRLCLVLVDQQSGGEEPAARPFVPPIPTTPSPPGAPIYFDCVRAEQVRVFPLFREAKPSLRPSLLTVHSLTLALLSLHEPRSIFSLGLLPPSLLTTTLCTTLFVLCLQLGEEEGERSEEEQKRGAFSHRNPKFLSSNQFRRNPISLFMIVCHLFL